VTEKPKNRVEEGSKDERFPPIDATPEQVAKALLRMPPMKDDDWDYIKKKDEQP